MLSRRDQPYTGPIYHLQLALFMQLSVFAITIPRAPPGICNKNLPPPWGFCILAFARGWRFDGVGPKGRAFVYKRFLPFLEFFIVMARIGDWQHFGFIYCSEILYVFKENYSNLYWTKAKKWRLFFIKDRSRMRNSLITLENLSV